MADDEDEWRFSIDDVGPDDSEGEEETGAGVEDAAVDEGTGTAVDGTAVDEETGAAVEDTEDSEWVTMVGEDDDGPTVGVATGDPASAEADGDEGNVAGTLAPEETVEPGTPDLENVVFTTAGAIVTVLVFAAVIVPLDPVSVGSLASVVVAGAALLYVFFRRA